MLGLTGCLNDIDNYEAPSGGINGLILDAQTNEPIPLPVSGSTGVIINLQELNTDATKTVDFYAKADGSYENSMVFNGEYKVVVNGPFVTPCEGNVSVKEQTSFDLTATPYSRISATASASGKVITITYQVTPTDPSYTLSSVVGLWNFAPGVDNGQANLAGKKTAQGWEGTIVFDLTDDSTFNNNLHKIQANDNTLYVRVGATINGVVNYSPILTVTL